MRIGIDASRTFVENPTGTERYAWEVTSRILLLPEAKLHNWILYTKPENFEILSSKFEISSNIKIINIKMPYLWTQAGLAVRTWADKLDVLWVPAHTLPLLRKPGIKTVVTIHGLEYEWLPAYENPLQRWYLPLSTIYATKSASKVIAVSKFTKEQVVKRIGVSEDKIKVIYEGFTNTPSSNPSPKLGEGRKGGVLSKFGLKSKQYLLFVGTIQPRKNLVRIIEAFARLGTDLKLVIAGKWGWMYGEVKEAPIRFGVEDKVVFTGYINDTERNSLLANALLYVQPSITEGFGLPLLEAMAMGVPVVSSEGGALGEILGTPFSNLPPNLGGRRKWGVEKNTGLLFDPYDISDISEKLQNAIESDILREELIKLGKARVKEFSWDKAARETYNILIGKS